MKNKTLSIVPYYGGKAKLAKYISEMLCTDGISTFIVPFGGGARDLLNAPVYPREIYNDLNIGMCVLIKLLGDKKTGIKLINRLYDTEYSEEYFNECLAYRNKIEDVYIENFINTFKKFLLNSERQNKQINGKEKPSKMFNRMLEQLYLKGEGSENIVEAIEKKYNFNEEQKERLRHFKDEYDILFRGFTEYRENEFIKYSDTVDKELNAYKEWYKRRYKMSEKELIEKLKEKPFCDEFEKNIAKEITLIQNRIYKEILLGYRANEIELDEEEQYRLAVSTYVTYTQSMNGMGRAFAKNKFKSNEQYQKKINNLIECMGRLEGVEVNQINAFLYFFNADKIKDFMDNIDNDDYLYNNRNEYMSEWLKRPDVLIYCDPTYLKQYEEGEEEPKPSSEYNPGIGYKHYWERREHEIFLKLIRYAECKLLVSNYNDAHHIYDKYLSGGNWKKTEIETTTSVCVGKKANQRTECL